MYSVNNAKLRNAVVIYLNKLSQYLPGRLEENHEKMSKNSRYRGFRLKQRIF